MVNLPNVAVKYSGNWFLMGKCGAPVQMKQLKSLFPKMALSVASL